MTETTREWVELMWMRLGREITQEKSPHANSVYVYLIQKSKERRWRPWSWWSRKGRKTAWTVHSFVVFSLAFPSGFVISSADFFPTKYFSVFFCCCCCRTEKIYFPSTIFLSFFLTSLVFFFRSFVVVGDFFLAFPRHPHESQRQKKKSSTIIAWHSVFHHSFYSRSLAHIIIHRAIFYNIKKKSREIFPFSRSSFAFFSSVSIFFLKIGKVSSFTVARRLVCNIFRLNNIFNFVTLYFTLKWQ